MDASLIKTVHPTQPCSTLKEKLEYHSQREFASSRLVLGSVEDPNRISNRNVLKLIGTGDYIAAIESSLREVQKAEPLALHLILTINISCSQMLAKSCIDYK